MSRQTLSSYPQIILAGMPRTGTESIKQALEILYGKGARAYHMTEVLNRPKHLEIWSDLQQGWEPLCNSLEFDVPQCDFPHLNAGTSGPSKVIANAVRQLSLRRILIAAGIVFVGGVIKLWIS